jgi:D-arabinose 1-dehydrogenase-like Zn-dependent alcohol dehydrogenase
MRVSPVWLLSGCRSVEGWFSVTSIDSQDALAFRPRACVRPMNETFPMKRVPQAHDRSMSGRVRFRVALTIKT